LKGALDRFRLFTLFALLALAAQAASAQSEGWFRAGTGLGDTNKPRLAIADFAARSDAAKPHASSLHKSCATISNSAAF